MNHPDLREVAKKFEDKLKKIKVFVTDVDGVMTNGQITYHNEDIGFNRSFHTLDGYGLKMLKEAGLKVGVISGGVSPVLQKRMTGLGVDWVFGGYFDKREPWLKIEEASGCSPEEMLYVGDDFFDMPLLKRAGFSATTPHASHEVQELVDYTTFRWPGQGCLREVIDMVRYAQGIVHEVPDFE